MPAISDVVPICLRVPRREIAYVKFIFESYEGVATVRTLDRHRATLVVLTTTDLEPTARAVVASLAAAEDLLVKVGMTRRAARGALAPLARASVDHVAAIGPVASLTGPIARGDAATVRRHLAALSPRHRALYVALGRQALALARQAGLGARKARAVATQLGSKRG